VSAVAEGRVKDEVSGVDTTGHEWDGIRELNNPMPRWWVWTFYVTILWAVGYWIAMPAWPLVSSHTRGLLGYSQRAAVAEDIAAAKRAQAAFVERIAGLDVARIREDPELFAFAQAGGRSAFAVNCSQCHGSGAAGARGYPNLNDDEWLWGGAPEDIERSIRYGVRSGHPEARVNDMPAFFADGVLTWAQVNDVAEHVLALSGRSTDAAAAARGKALFADNCAACHGEDGRGKREMGAPNLADAIWLYGGEKADVVRSVAQSRRGVMPAWEGRLDEATIKQLAIWVHSLGGGE
jgi:cytochrome c oxidase cbb3-type subunit III